MAVAAETSFATEVSASLLVCSICHSQFQKPRVLSCQHSFCAKCLKGWLQTRNRKTSVLKCAVCREITVLPPGGVDSLPENYALKGLISMMKAREKQQAGKASAEKITPKEKTPAKESRNRVVSSAKSNADKKGKKSGEDITEAIVAEVKKQDQNANVQRAGKKKIFANGKKKAEPIHEAQNSSESSDEDSDDSSMDDSEESSSDEQSSSGDDEEYTSGSESDVPPTPTLKLYGEIKVGMEVYIFNSRGKKFPGRVKLLEECKVTGYGPTRTYAGIELARENTKLITEDIDVLENSYLSYWISEHEKPCVVVRADHCVPVAVVDQLLSQT